MTKLLIPFASALAGVLVTYGVGQSHAEVIALGILTGAGVVLERLLTAKGAR